MFGAIGHLKMLSNLFTCRASEPSMAGDDLAAFDLVDFDRVAGVPAREKTGAPGLHRAAPPRSGGRRRIFERGCAGRDDRGKIEEASEPVAVFFRGLKAFEFFDVEREVCVAVHKANHMVPLMDQERDRLVLADRDADLAGEAGDRS